MKTKIFHYCFLLFSDSLPSKSISLETPRKIPFKDVTNDTFKTSSGGLMNDQGQTEKIQHQTNEEIDYEAFFNEIQFEKAKDGNCFCCGKDKKTDMEIIMDQLITSEFAKMVYGDDGRHSIYDFIEFDEDITPPCSPKRSFEGEDENEEEIKFVEPIELPEPLVFEIPLPHEEFSSTLCTITIPNDSGVEDDSKISFPDPEDPEELEIPYFNFDS